MRLALADLRQVIRAGASPMVSEGALPAEESLGVKRHEKCHWGGNKRRQREENCEQLRRTRAEPTACSNARRNKGSCCKATTSLGPTSKHFARSPGWANHILDPTLEPKRKVTTQALLSRYLWTTHRIGRHRHGASRPAAPQRHAPGKLALE